MKCSNNYRNGNFQYHRYCFAKIENKLVSYKFFTEKFEKYGIFE